MLAHVTVFLLQKLGMFYSILRCWWENWRLELLVEEKQVILLLKLFFKTNGIYNLFNNLSDVSNVCMAELICTYTFHTPHKKNYIYVVSYFVVLLYLWFRFQKGNFSFNMYVVSKSLRQYIISLFFNFRWR